MKPNTFPVAPGGVAPRANMSRDGEAGRESCSCEGGRKPKIRKRDAANREQERCSAREPERYDPLVGARAIRSESAG